MEWWVNCLKRFGVSRLCWLLGLIRFLWYVLSALLKLKSRCMGVLDQLYNITCHVYGILTAQTAERALSQHRVHHVRGVEAVRVVRVAARQLVALGPHIRMTARAYTHRTAAFFRRRRAV